jgi:hypothetical protein
MVDYFSKAKKRVRRTFNRKLKITQNKCLCCSMEFDGWVRQKFCSSKCRAKYNFANKTEEQKQRYKNTAVQSFKKRRVERPEAHIYFRVKVSAKQRNLEFNLDLEDIKIPEFCPLLGIKLEYTPKGRAKFNTPSVDRIDSCKGYIKGNVWVISNKANTMKQDVSLKLLKTFAKNVIEKL